MVRCTNVRHWWTFFLFTACFQKQLSRQNNSSFSKHTMYFFSFWKVCLATNNLLANSPDMSGKMWKSLKIVKVFENSRPIFFFNLVNSFASQSQLLSKNANICKKPSKLISQRFANDGKNLSIAYFDLSGWVH